MKYFLVTAVTLLVGIAVGHAQSDTTIFSSDTLESGNFIIIKKNKTITSFDSTKKGGKTVTVSIDMSSDHSTKKASNSNINWGILDIGFANYNDQTNYSQALGKGYINPNRPVDAASLHLIPSKSTNVNIWFFMQKVPLVKQYLNLKYGVGLEMFNFRFDKNISYRKDPAPTVFYDSISYTKNKLYAGYVTVPMMLNFTAKPGHKKSFSCSVGLSAGYLISSYNKQKSAERGKQKSRGDFNLNPWRVAAISEVSVGPIRLYGSYSLTTLHRSETGIEQFPYAMGIRFSKW